MEIIDIHNAGFRVGATYFSDHRNETVPVGAFMVVHDGTFKHLDGYFLDTNPGSPTYRQVVNRPEWAVDRHYHTVHPDHVNAGIVEVLEAINQNLAMLVAESKKQTTHHATIAGK